MFKDFNINYHVKVKLTERGKKILYENWKDPAAYPTDDDGYTPFQLWDLMENFGKEFHLGISKNQLPFETDIKVDIKNE